MKNSLRSLTDIHTDVKFWFDLKMLTLFYNSKTHNRENVIRFGVIVFLHKCVDSTIFGDYVYKKRSTSP